MFIYFESFLYYLCKLFWSCQFRTKGKRFQVYCTKNPGVISLNLTGLVPFNVLVPLNVTGTCYLHMLILLKTANLLCSLTKGYNLPSCSCQLPLVISPEVSSPFIFNR